MRNFFAASSLHQEKSPRTLANNDMLQLTFFLLDLNLFKYAIARVPSI